MHIQAAPIPEGHPINFFVRARRCLRKAAPSLEFSKPPTFGENFVVWMNPGVYVNIVRDSNMGISIDVFVGAWPMQQGVVRFRHFITNLRDLVEVRKEYIAWRNSPRLLPFRQLQDVTRAIKDDSTLVLLDNLLRDLEWLLITRRGK